MPRPCPGHGEVLSGRGGPPEKERYTVGAGEGFWGGVKNGMVKPPQAWFVVRPGASPSQQNFDWAAAVCFSEEDAKRVAEALSKTT